MTTNADLTIYAQWANPATQCMEYKRSCIEGVSWYSQQKTNVVNNAIESADVYKIRIPEESVQLEGKEYIAPEEYRVLTTDRVDSYWTIGTGDLFVKGIVTDEIESMEQLFQTYENAGKVLSVSDNRRGLEMHWRIGGAS